MGIYPVVTALLWLLGPLLDGLPLPVVTLVLTLVLVSLMSYVVMPRLTRAFGGWLSRCRALAGDTARPSGTPHPAADQRRAAHPTQVRAVGRARSRSTAIGPPHTSHVP